MQGPALRPRVGRHLALRLAVALLSLASVLILAGVWSLGRSAETSRRSQAADQLAVGLGTALRAAETRARELETRVEALARDPVFQEASARQDTAALRRIVATQPGIMVQLGARRIGASPAGLGLIREVVLAQRGRPATQIVGFLPVDGAFYRELSAESTLAAAHRLLVVENGEVVLGSGPGTRLRMHREQEAELGRERYLARTATVSGSSIELVAAAPIASISSEIREFQLRSLAAAFGSLALLTLLGAVLGGPILRALGDLSRVTKAAETDALTGVANRGSFDARFAVEARRAQDLGLPLSLILFDLDHFKGINDEHGHQAGDEVLRRLGALLQDRLRGTDFGARYGGEEFAVLLPDTDWDGAMLLAERLRVAVSELRVATGYGEVTPTASFGVASFPEQTLPRLFAAADLALYEAKRAGRNLARAAARAPA